MLRWTWLVALSLAAGVSYSGEPLYWSDGRDEWPVWQSAEEVAVFERQTDIASKAMPAQASLIKTHTHLQIWQVPLNPTGETAMKGVDSLPWSPVFYEFPNGGGRKMALSGGIILTFKPGWSHDRIAAWLAVRGLSSMGHVNLMATTYLIKSPAGIASLQLANALRAEDAIAAAAPNWWIEVEPR